jgi:hypothetical protein
LGSSRICNFAQLGILVSILIFVSVALFLFLKANGIGIAKKHLLTIWAVKLIYTVVFIQIFSNYYGPGEALQGDSYKFQEDGRVLNQIAQEDFSKYVQVLFGFSGDEEALHQNELKNTVIWAAGENGDQINDNRLMIRINSVIHFFSDNDPYVHALVFSFLALIGLILIFKTFKNHVQYPILFLYVICLFPSIGFWGGGTAKEALMILSLGMIIYPLGLLVQKKFNFISFLILIIGVLFSLINKPYVGLIVLPFVLVFCIGYYLQWKKIILVISTLIAISISILLTYAPKNMNLLDKISYKQRDLTNLAKGGVFFITDSSFCAFDYSYFENFDTIAPEKIVVQKNTPGEYKLFGQDEFYPFEINPSDQKYDLYLVVAPSSSYFESAEINYDGWNLIKSMPETIWNVWVRPFPNDPGGNLKLASFIQNMALILFGVFVLFRFRKPNQVEFFWLYFLIGSVLLITFIIGWTTPVFGAIARYKVPAELFLLCAFFILLKSNKITSK